jgi:hypothetical protein
MRNAARPNMSNYPLPESEGQKLRVLLSYSESASVIDPCAGQRVARYLEGTRYRHILLQCEVGDFRADTPPAPTPVPIAAPLPPITAAPVITPRAAPPTVLFAVLPPRDFAHSLR